MNKSENINELAKALAKVQAKIKPAPFDSVNPYYKSKYASLGSVIEVAKVLASEGLSYSQLPISNGWYAGVENILMHESGEWISQEFLMPLDADSKNPIQEAGKAITYARRYGLASMLGIYSDEDNDGNDVSVQKTEPRSGTKVPEGDGRPYPPEVLKEKIAKYAESVSPASDKQRKLFVMMMGQSFSDDNLRHDVQEYLFGARSANDIDGKVINSALKWMDLKPDSGGAYLMGEMSAKELTGVVNAYLLSKGQQKMNRILDELGF